MQYNPWDAGHMIIHNWLENEASVPPDLDIGHILYITVKGDSNHGYFSNSINKFPYRVFHKKGWGYYDTEQWRYDLESVDAENPITTIILMARRWKNEYGSPGDIVYMEFKIDTGVPMMEYKVIKQGGYFYQGEGPHFNATVVITH